MSNTQQRMLDYGVVGLLVFFSLFMLLAGVFWNTGAERALGIAAGAVLAMGAGMTLAQAVPK